MRRGLEEYVAKKVIEHMFSDRYKALERYEEAVAKVKLLARADVTFCLECGFPCEIAGTRCCIQCERGVCNLHESLMIEHMCIDGEATFSCNACALTCKICETPICFQCTCTNSECGEHCRNCVPECSSHFEAEITRIINPLEESCKNIWRAPEQQDHERRVCNLFKLLRDEIYEKVKLEHAGKWIGVYEPNLHIITDTKQEAIRLLEQHSPRRMFIVVFLPKKH